MAELNFLGIKFSSSKEKLRVELQELRDLYSRSVELQEIFALKIADLESQDVKYKGNAYTSYENAVIAIEKKYNATADWGVVLTGNIIDLRAAFIIGNGLQIRPTGKKKEAEAELKWIDDFMAYNKLDRELAQELAKEAEIEGKIAIKLAVEKANGWRDYDQMVSMRFISWTDRKYKIIAAPNDYLKYEKLEWMPTGTDPTKQPATGKETLKEVEFVYNKFGGRISDPNDAQPKIMKCLTQIDDIDKALRDWREINNLFAAPVPDLECEDEEAAKDADSRTKDFNFKIKKMLIHARSTFGFKGPNMEGVDSLKEEMIAKMKIIAGTTAIPIHFLGLLDLLKNRATGENTREMVVAGTSKERIIWIGTYAEVFEKAMIMWNEAKKKKSTRLDPSQVQVAIPVYTAEQWEHLEKVLIPLYLGGAISIEYLLSQVPDLDVEEELSRQEDKGKSENESLKSQIEALKEELKMAKAMAGEEETPPEI